MPNHSTIPDSYTVIYLGHTCNVPLIRAPSELGDGLEPHDTIYQYVDGRVYPATGTGCSRGVPGVVQAVGTGGVHTGY